MARSRHKHVLRPRLLPRLGLAASAVLAVAAPAAAIVWPEDPPVDAASVHRATSTQAATSPPMRVGTPPIAAGLVQAEALPETTASPATRKRSAPEDRASSRESRRAKAVAPPSEPSGSSRPAGPTSELVAENRWVPGTDHRRLRVVDGTSRVSAKPREGAGDRSRHAEGHGAGAGTDPSATATATPVRSSASPRPVATADAVAPSPAAADAPGNANEPVGGTGTLPQEPATSATTDPAVEAPAEPLPSLPSETCTPAPAGNGQGLALGREVCLPLP